MQGFKSFPDKIKLEFDKGLTGVVGPNGSGKSNIADAVRWVLGEQSSKTLRGAKMEDVIFSGTQLRKPVGFAAVTLNIVNNKGLLQIPAEEVSITRKLYRSGDSEYLINGSQVRLKDISELFMDTGLGRDGYSIIGQGRVAEIVSAKSNERREIFEEAAGISKFRYKKEEAERKLSAAEENLLRLRDIMSELELRVEPLRIQSEKAEKFLRYSEEKKQLECTVWINKLSEQKKTITSLGEKILINKTEYENLNSDIERLEEEVQSAFTAMQQSSVRIEVLQGKILEAERANSQVTSNIAVFENDISHCEEAILSLEKQLGEAQLSDKDNERLIAERMSEIEDTDKRLSELAAKIEESRTELERITDRQSGANEEFNSDTAALNNLYIKQSEYKTTLASSEDTIKEIESQLEIADENTDRICDEAEDYKRQSAETADGIRFVEESLQEHNNRLVGLNRLFQTKNEKYEQVKKRCDEINMKIREYQQKRRLLTDLENSMEGFANSVKSVIRAGKNQRIRGIRGTVAQLIEVDGKYSVAIETALGGALQNVIVENEDTAKRCINLLKEERAGRATFLPITSVKGRRLDERGLEGRQGFVAVASEIVSCDGDYGEIISSLLGRIVIAEDIDMAAIIAKDYGYRFKICTLDGQVINAGGSFTGGSVAKSTGVLTRKNEIDELEQKERGLNDELSQTSEQLARLKAETDKMGFDIEAEREQIIQVNQDKIRFESELRRLEDMTRQSQERLRDTEARKKHLQARKAEQESNIEFITAELEKSAVDILQLEERLSKSGELREKMHRRRTELSETVSALRMNEMELTKDKAAIQQSIEHIRLQSEQLSDSYIRLTGEISRQTEIIEQKRRDIQTCREMLDSSGSDVSGFTSSIEQERREHSECERRANELRSGVREKTDRKENCSSEITRLQERQTTVQKDYDGIVSEMWEQYGMSVTDAGAVADKTADIQSAQRALNEIKQKIRGLGNVNVAAIEEYKEVSERYTLMKTQLNDVELSKNELERLISEFTENMRRQFSKSFEDINSAFKDIFVELFGGGKAELILTNPEDVLESGIEIHVAPPGKVIKNLSLLSGGEQAFVAIAIYFAILKLRPAPFCILDEIEAALDDVNVSKYASYLRNFTDTTQFILVTHRRGTMEEADVLYGVTMQEKGISKLLKLDNSKLDLPERQ